MSRCTCGFCVDNPRPHDPTFGFYYEDIKTTCCCKCEKPIGENGCMADLGVARFGTITLVCGSCYESMDPKDARSLVNPFDPDQVKNWRAKNRKKG